MKQSQTRQLPSSIDVEYGGWIKSRVILTSAVPKIAEKYNLTPAMIREMGKYAGDYPIANMQMVKALVKRGIMKPMDEREPDGGHDFTALGRRLCSQMFAVIRK